MAQQKKKKEEQTVDNVRGKDFLLVLSEFNNTAKHSAHRTTFARVVRSSLKNELTTEFELRKDFGFSAKQIDRAWKDFSTQLGKDEKKKFLDEMTQRANELVQS